MLRKWKACGIIVFLTAVAFLSVSPIAVKTSTAQDATGTLADILERGKIKVGSEIAYPPMEDYDPVTGEEIGFDIDLMDAIMEHVSDAYDTDLTVEWIYSDWTPIIPNLLAEQFDVIMSSMTITSERELQVDFTRWYYQSAMGILVAEDNPKNILTENDLNDSSIKIGVQIGTTTHLWLQAYDIDDVATVMTYTSFP
ncbi:MAG: transporter substrate-binding domain-containing protein, partial [Candidatus Hodarchaeota archaeon]